MRVLVLGDTHAPWVDYACLQACYEFSLDFKPDVVIQVGDLVDQKAWSRYPKDPEDPCPAEEWEMTEDCLAYMHKLFPKLIILEGNHNRRLMMRALEVGVPKKLIRGLEEVFDYSGWHWHVRPEPHVIDNVAYIHGDEMLGNAWQKAQKLGMSVVQGHDHLGYLQYINTFTRTIFGMSSGCMIDRESIAAKYAARNPLRSFLGWSTVIDGLHPSLHHFQGGIIR